MRKIIYQVWISLDGYAADANHSTKFFEDPKYGGSSDKDLLDYMDNIDTILLGANTYTMLVEYWPDVSPDKEVMAGRLNSTPKIVFSKSLKEAPWGKWPAAEIISSDAISAIKKLKGQNKKDMVLWGSISLAKSLMKENLIDEYHIRVVPIVLGKGVSLFGDVSEINLKLTETKQYPSGMVLLEYKPG
jgi:dihydrofolate reductase